MFEKESEAWQRIADQIEQHGLTPVVTASRLHLYFGLCRELMLMYQADAVTEATLIAMRTRITQHLKLRAFHTRERDGEYVSSAWLDVEGVAETRIIAAQLLALEAAEDEANV